MTEPKKTDRRMLNCWITPELREGLRERAFRDDTTITELVETGMRQYLGLPPAPAKGA